MALGLPSPNGTLYTYLMCCWFASVFLVVELSGVASQFHLYTGPGELLHHEEHGDYDDGATHADGAGDAYDGAIEASRLWSRLQPGRGIGDNETVDTTPSLLYCAKVITNGAPHLLRFASGTDRFALAIRHILAHKVKGGEGCLSTNCVAGKLVDVMERCQHQIDVDKTESAICYVESAAVPPPPTPPPDASVLFGFDFKRRR